MRDLRRVRGVGLLGGVVGVAACVGCWAGVGVFGIVEGDFPPEEEAAKEEKVAGEATGEKPSA